MYLWEVHTCIKQTQKCKRNPRPGMTWLLSYCHTYVITLQFFIKSLRGWNRMLFKDSYNEKQSLIFSGKQWHDTRTQKNLKEKSTQVFRAKLSNYLH